MNKENGRTTFIEFTLFRSFFMMNSSLLMIYGQKINVFEVGRELRCILASRCLVGTFVFLITTLALKMLPMSIFVMIVNTTPFMTAVVQFVWIRASVTKVELFGMIGSYIGILIMGVSTPLTSQSDSDNYVLGILYTLIAALALSYVSVATNKMKSVHYLVITFYLAVSMEIVCVLLMILEYYTSNRVPF